MIGKRFLAIFLCVLLLASMLPLAAWAEENGAEDGADPDGFGINIVPEDDPDKQEQLPEIEEPENDGQSADDNSFVDEQGSALPETPTDPEIPTDPVIPTDPETPTDPEPPTDPETPSDTVTLRFVLSPADAELSVNTIDENSEKREIEPEEDGSYRLLPGVYFYTAVCEGYVAAEDVELIVDAADEPSDEPELIYVGLSAEESGEPTPEAAEELEKEAEGTGPVTIEELISILGITSVEEADAFLRDVEDVQFGSSSADPREPLPAARELKSAKSLKSSEPSGGEELLTVTMKDGTVFMISLTDTQEGDALSNLLREELSAFGRKAAAVPETGSRNVQVSDDLTNFLVNAVITGAAQNADGVYEVEAGKEYSIILSFAESSAYQFQNDAVLTYQLPAGVEVIKAQSGPLVINIVYKGRTYRVDAAFTLTTEGLLSVSFDQNDPEYPRLEESTDVSFRFTYEAQFDGTAEKILFSDEIERDIIFDEPIPGEAFVEKSAVYDEATGTFHYTITVSATGDVANVKVKDTVLGNALIVDDSSIVISGNSSRPTGGIANSGFEYTFPSMRKDEVITIEYDARVKFSADIDNDGRITADQTKNTVSVDTEPGDPHSSEYSREISFRYAVKKDGTEHGTTSEGDKIIDWEIEYNPLALVAVGGNEITDSISAPSADYMKYYGDGITVNAYDRSGALVYSAEISYSELTEHSDHMWKYTIPSDHKQPWRYVITYQTVVDMTLAGGSGSPVILSNTANGDEGSVQVAPKDQVAVVKIAEAYTTKEIAWDSTLSIPQGGLTKAEVIDYLPYCYVDGHGGFFDVFKEGSLEITGLLSGECYDVTYSTGTIEIVFYRDAQNTPGLLPFSGGRTIHVKLTTLVNQERLQLGYELGGSIQTHANTIRLNTTQNTASVVFGKPGIEKDGETLDGKLFKYTLTISGLQDDSFSITDTFDTNLLEVATSGGDEWSWNHMHMWGGYQYSQDSGRTAVSYADTENGIVITANAVPKDTNGKYYPYYKIIYYLKLRDGVDLMALAVANGGEYDLVNTAIWAGHDTEYTYKVKYDFLNKELLNDGQIGGTNRTAQYRITFNPAKATLNGGEPMEMKDVLSANLNLDYGSVSIQTEPAGVHVPYSISGGLDEHDEPDGTTVATYTIPDSTKVVITYSAEVRGSGTQMIVNKVSVNGDEESVDDTADYAVADEGEGAIASFKIVKVDGNDASKKLSGVRFKVFADNPGLDFGEKTKHAKEIELVTDENGEIFFEGADYDFYFNEVYHVQEIEAPEDYGKLASDCLITLTDEMSLVDYGHSIYYYSDSMQIKNYPLEGLVVEKQVESENAADKNRDYTFRVSILKDDGSVDEDYNEKNGDDQFVNGAFEFQLKNGEQKMLWGFLKGTRYQVEETDGDGFYTTVTYSVFDKDGNVTEIKTDESTSHTGELTQENEVIVFRNAKVGSLKIKKNVTVDGAATTGTSADGDYTFVITGPDNYSSTQTITITNGGSNEIRVDNLLPGSYTVTENVSDNPAGMVLVGQNGRTVTVTADNTAGIPTAEFTNNKTEVGSLKIKKNVTVNGKPTATTRADGTYSFTITGPGDYASTQTITITGGVSGEVQVNNLVPGTYIVSEDTSKNPSGVTLVSGNDVRVTVTANNTAAIPTAPFTNDSISACEGEIKVRKVLNGRAWTYNDSFTFTLSAPEGTPMPAQTSITVTRFDPDQTRSFGSIEFTEPGRYVYTVRELRGTIRHIRYDTKAYSVVIEVQYDAQGNLVAKPGTRLIRTVTITNTYRPYIPGTGDSRDPFLFAGLLIASTAGLLREAFRRKKLRK